ncbi:MAG: class I SAM-dependent methyltransferase [Gemmatimonadetes bacterium]|nr:class I SAM-dependent methyltransferase [Gemmatimonadota bacterium]
MMHSAFRISMKRAWNWIRIAVRHYPRGFWRQDLWLAALYLAKNPFRISREFWDRETEALGKRAAAGNDGAATHYTPDPHTYGETPLPAMERIAARAGWTADDVIYDLGCGRGTTTFFIEHLTKARVTGIDRVPVFVARGNGLARKLGLARVAFLDEDLLEADYRNATALYYYGTGAHDFYIQLLIGHLARQLRPGTKIATVTYPLTNYRPDLFTLEGSERLDFLWGRSDVYFQRFDPERGASVERPGRDLSRYPQTAEEADE